MTEERLHKTLIFLLWVLLMATMGIYFLLILPHQGLFANGEGDYLYSGLGSSSSSVWDVSRLGALLNSGFMALGFHSLLSLRYLFFVLLLLAVGLLNYSLSPPQDRTYTFALSSILAISGFFITIANYQNLPPIFLMMSLGLFFGSVDAKEKNPRILCQIFSAVTLLLAGLANLAVMPATIFTAFAFIYFAHYHKQKASVLSVIFFLLLILIGGAIVALLPTHGMAGFERVLHWSTLPKRLSTMGWWLLQHYALPLLLAVPLIYRRYRGESKLAFFNPVMYRIVVLVLAFCLLSWQEYAYFVSLQVSHSAYYTPVLFARLLVILSPYFIVFCYRDNELGKRILLSAAALTLFFLLESASSVQPILISQIFFIPALATIVCCGMINYITGIQLRRTRNFVSTLCIMMLLTLYAVGVIAQLSGEARMMEDNTKTMALGDGSVSIT